MTDTSAADKHRQLRRWLAPAALFLLALLVFGAMRWRHDERLLVRPVPARPAAAVTSVARVWMSTADRRLRLTRQPDAVASVLSAKPAEVVIDLTQTYQTMAGFGAALTDSSAWLIQNKLNPQQRDALLQELFGPSPGLNFNLLRVTIGASDFSRQHYTLDDLAAGEVDPQLQHFNLAGEARTVMAVVQAIRVIQPQLSIIASPWSAPAWMKTSANLISGTLFEEYEATYANYLVRYVDAFRKVGIPIFALTVQNEPTFLPLTYPGMEMSAEVRARIIGQYLGPALAAREPHTLILGWDHNWDAPEQPLSVLADAAAQRYIGGIAWHCYRGDPHSQSQVHRAFPQKDVFITECSGGDWPSSKNGELLLFARNIVMAGIRNRARGVVYWNLALDEQHGPHAGGCDACKGVVTIDSGTGAISRNDEYYAFGQFSRFVLPGALRVKSSSPADGVDNVAFQNAHGGSVVLVVVNGNEQAHHLSVSQGATQFQYELPASSVATFEWPPGATAAAAPAGSSARPPALGPARAATQASATSAPSTAVH